MMRNDLSLNTNPFIFESDEEDALEEFHLLDPSDDEDHFIDKTPLISAAPKTFQIK